MTTTAIIILSVLLFFSVCLNVIVLLRRSDLVKRLKRIRTKLESYKKHLDVNYPIYFAKVYEHNPSVWGVYRVTFHENTRLTTTIKMFDTQDAEYNRNGAEELVEKLTEPLCY